MAKDELKTRFLAELKIIPAWAWVLAALTLVFVQLIFSLRSKEPGALAPAAMVTLGILAGIFMACFPLLIGYINVDAGRRGMSRTLWTLLAIVIPNAIGFILYFLLRPALSSLCPACGAATRPDYGYCPKCGKNLALHCSRCQHAVQADDVYCPNCGTSLTSAEPAVPPQPQAS